MPETINYFKQSPEQNRIESSTISVIKKTKKKKKSILKFGDYALIKMSFSTGALILSTERKSSC